MVKNVSNPPGNSKQRKKFRKQVAGVLQEMGIEPAAIAAVVPPKNDRQTTPKAAQMPRAAPRETSRDKFDDALAIIGFAGTLGSWGWSVVAPDSSVWFGSLLLFMAMAAMSLAVYRLLEPRRVIGCISVILLLVSFVAADWFLLVKPQRGKPFKELLASGYHQTEECGNHPAKEPMPAWMRDASKAWQAQVEQLIAEKLDPKDLQIWRGAVVYGLVTDENMEAYQCYFLSEKVAALETIINARFDPELKHRPYEGPLYWLESVDGKVDITEAMKNGAGRFTIHERPAPNSSVQVTGKVSH